MKQGKNITENTEKEIKKSSKNMLIDIGRKKRRRKKVNKNMRFFDKLVSLIKNNDIKVIKEIDLRNNLKKQKIAKTHKI